MAASRSKIANNDTDVFMVSCDFDPSYGFEKYSKLTERFPHAHPRRDFERQYVGVDIEKSRVC